jgi:hypothetical protein
MPASTIRGLPSLGLLNWAKRQRLTTLAIGSTQLLIVAVISLAACLYAITYIRSAYDDNTYHIPLAVSIATHRNPYYIDADNAPFIATWFPAAAESLVGLLAAVTGTINSTNLTGGLVFLLIMVVTYKFAGLWVSEWWEKLTAVGLVSTTPLLLGQTLAFYVDIHMAFVVSLSLYLMCRSLVSRQASYAYYGAAVALLAAGIKYFGIPYDLILLPAAAYCIFRSQSRKLPRAALVLLVASFVFSSGWYFRNWALRGNPLYPLPLPRSVRPILELTGIPYQAQESFEPGTHGVAAFPHPLIPVQFVRYEYTTDMREDGFGGGFVMAAILGTLSFAFIRRMPAPKRHAWVFLLVTTALLVFASPFKYGNPRYVLFLPLVLGLSPAILQSALASPGDGQPSANSTARRPLYEAGRVLISLAVLLYGAAYTYANLVDAPTQRTSLYATVINLIDHNPMSVVSFEYVQPGHLRIGYLGGANMFVAALYDTHMTNALIPLHYKNEGRYYGEEFSTPEAFLAYVESLHLDYIHIFDRNALGADLLIQHFPDIVKMSPSN